VEPLPLGATLADYEAQAPAPGVAEGRAELARRYSFRDWPALVEWVTAVNDPGSPVQRFETAVEAIITGNVEQLERLLAEDPELVYARSTIVTNLAPPRHRATLLHYVAANGVEQWRQKTPSNAVEVARALLRAGAEPDALAFMYSGQLTTLTMLVSSVHPAAAGVQAALTETLLDFGAAVDGRGSGDNWVPPLLTALAFGYPQSAEVLVSRGASINTVAAAAGLGRLADVQRLLPDSDGLDRHRATALGAQYGHTDVVSYLLDAGEDPNRWNPPGFHAHSTPLHQAAYHGHLDTVQLLVARGARRDVLDRGHHATPEGWAEHGQRTAVVEYLRSINP
jgi:ankyrin repeat protein